MKISVKLYFEFNFRDKQNGNKSPSLRQKRKGITLF